jgi:hypothetical protein
VRVLKVIGVLIVGPFLGLLVGSVVAAFFLPPDPTGRGAPGDGILILFWLGIGLVVSLPSSVLFARWIWHRSARLEN